MNFQRTLYISLFALFCALIPLSHISRRSFQKIDQIRTELTEKYARALALTNHLRYHQAQEEALALRYLLKKDPVILGKITITRHQFRTTLETIQKLDRSPGTVKILREIEKNKDEDLKNFLSSTVKDDKVPALIDGLFAHELARMTTKRNLVNLLTKKLDRQLVITLLMTKIGFLLIIGVLIIFARMKRTHDLQLEKISTLRKEVLETVSHDLKNPISSIQLGIQMLFRMKGLPDQVREKVQSNLRRIESSTFKMKGLIDDLLDSAKLESGNLELDLQSHNPSMLAMEALEEISGLAESKNVAIEFEGAQLAYDVQCDRNRVLQVFSNLLGNALKFTPPEGMISIRLEEDADKTYFHVRDSGEGISSEQLPHLFDRYWQAEKKGKTGTGLGLSIVKGIIDGHGGDIIVNSDQEHGTCFSFSLPHVLRESDPNTWQRTHEASAAMSADAGTVNRGLILGV